MIKSSILIFVAIAAFIISFFGVHSLTYKNPYVDNCRVNELAKELYKPLIPDPYGEETECDENQVYHIANVTDHCRLGCRSGCYCKKGYVRSEGRCISAAEAEQTCKKNEELVCGKSDCEPMCDIDQDQVCYLNRFNCKYSYNCWCKPGFIRMERGGCIPISDCPYFIHRKPEYNEL